MTLEKEQKSKIIKKFAQTETDTGSGQVQCAILTEKIKLLTEHLKSHRKDFSSRNGLIVLVARRKRILRYLERESNDVYLRLLKDLELKPIK